MNYTCGVFKGSPDENELHLWGLQVITRREWTTLVGSVRDHPTRMNYTCGVCKGPPDENDHLESSSAFAAGWRRPIQTCGVTNTNCTILLETLFNQQQTKKSVSVLNSFVIYLSAKRFKRFLSHIHGWILNLSPSMSRIFLLIVRPSEFLITQGLSSPRS
jgi:hypothetical protein